MGDAIELAVRDSATNTKAVILIHGFSGEAHTTFGMLPAFLAGDSGFNEWDIHCFGYPTRLTPDITGIWSSDPNLEDLAAYFAQTMDRTYGRYEELAIVAHSMGGLILQRALLAGAFSSRVSHAICMGTPSGGLQKALLGRLFKQQARDMTPDGAFITKLRRDWSARQTFKFQFLAVAGLSDQFVPPRSSHDPFAESLRAHVPGNHLEMVKPLSRESPTVALILDRLLGGRERVQQAVAATAPGGSVVNQALSLELLGREGEAIELLLQHVASSTDVQGALAGRYKRRWLRDPDRHWDDGERAFHNYAQAFETAAAQGDHRQAFYNGINTAFMQLAVHNDEVTAINTARRVLSHVDAAAIGATMVSGSSDERTAEAWRKAAEAEARLHLREPAIALALYRQAWSGLGPRDRSSMLQQAIWTTRLLGETFVETQLEAMLVTGS